MEKQWKKKCFARKVGGHFLKYYKGFSFLEKN
jgi:hypothetical protein